MSNLQTRRQFTIENPGFSQEGERLATLPGKTRFPHAHLIGAPDAPAMGDHLHAKNCRRLRQSTSRPNLVVISCASLQRFTWRGEVSARTPISRWRYLFHRAT